MTFKCSKNKFLEKVLNMKQIPIKNFNYKKDGNIIVLTNHKILQEFLNQASPKELIQVQHILAMEKYSIRAINDFVKEAGQDIVRRM